ncbi:MAG: universal stress protein, partial [Methanoregula sp.]|nr:universal stress protein [Methanoregula sp.]
ILILCQRNRIMFKKVLFPTDFSVYSQKIFHYIKEIPGIQEIILLHVVDATDHSIIGVSHNLELENAKILMEEKKEYLLHLGLKVQTLVNMLISGRQEGTISTNILETAKIENVSLIIIGARGKNLIHDLFLGSISSDVVRDAKTNVLIMRGYPMESPAGTPGEKTRPRIFSKLLLPLDFSRHAGDALSFVRGIQGIEEIILLHVVTDSGNKDEIDDTVNKSHTHLEEISKGLDGTGFLVTHHVRVGDPTEMILSVAEEDDVSLIAMSPHGKSWFEDSIIGSTAFAVANTAKKPVLIIRENKGVQP